MKFDAFNTNGGHILVGFMLLFVGAGFYLGHIPKGEDLIIVGSTLISRAMMDERKSAIDVKKEIVKDE